MMMTRPRAKASVQGDVAIAPRDLLTTPVCRKLIGDDVGRSGPPVRVMLPRGLRQSLDASVKDDNGRRSLRLWCEPNTIGARPA
jgi:hypothetical protein